MNERKINDYEKISIITVCFNSEKTIEQTIQSVINQSYGIENIEYIVIDGKSTDRTIEIINKYKDKISYFISEQDEGIYDAMNKGIAVANGDIIGILNSDDWYELNAIENVVKCFEKTETDIVYGKVRRVTGDGTMLEVNRTEPLSSVWFTMPVSHPATFVKREIYEQLGGFAIDYEIAADYEFILRCYINNTRFHHLDEELTYFRSTGISSTQYIKCAEEANRVAMKYIEKAPDKQRVLNENDYRIRLAAFREKCDSNPKILIDEIPEIKAGKVVVWGTGIFGRVIVKALLKGDVDIKYLVDSELEKQGRELFGIEIKTPSALRNDDVFVIVAIKRTNKEIKCQLSEWGIGRNRYLFLEEWIEMLDEKWTYNIIK